MNWKENANINWKEKFTIKGIFYLEIWDIRGKLLNSFEENLVVLRGRKAVRNLLVSGDEKEVVNKIAFGKGIEEENEELESLDDPFVKKVDDYELPDSTSIKYNWSLDFDEHNTHEITNYALYTDDEKMFSMKVRPVITKDPEISLKGSWTILL